MTACTYLLLRGPFFSTLSPKISSRERKKVGKTRRVRNPDMSREKMRVDEEVDMLEFNCEQHFETMRWMFGKTCGIAKRGCFPNLRTGKEKLKTHKVLQVVGFGSDKSFDGEGVRRNKVVLKYF